MEHFSNSPSSKTPDLSQALLHKMRQTSGLEVPSLATKKVEESNNSDLGLLREKINHVMNSYLMKVFELKQTVQEASMPPSRLKHKMANPKSLEEIRSNLIHLSKDLELLIQWGQGSLLQIQKVLEELPKSDSASSTKKTNLKFSSLVKRLFLPLKKLRFFVIRSK